MDVVEVAMESVGYEAADTSKLRGTTGVWWWGGREQVSEYTTRERTKQLTRYNSW